MLQRHALFYYNELNNFPIVFFMADKIQIAFMLKFPITNIQKRCLIIGLFLFSDFDTINKTI